MKLLIIGGTLFLGRHIAETALAAGHEVTLFHRGKTNPELFPDAVHIFGDRRSEDDLEKLASGRWDVVIDTCGYFPNDVGMLLERVAARADRYVFISTISVYADGPGDGLDEDSPLAELTDAMALDKITPESYGPLKVACERRAEEMMPEKTLVIRPGLIVGPHDPTDRFTYWPWRIAQGGKVLAPGYPEAPVQFIDVRDLGEWTVRMAEGGHTGIFNATGPAEPLGMGSLLENCRSTTGSNAELVWVDEKLLIEQNVAPFHEMPLWVPRAHEAMSRTGVVRAVEAGLTFRPIEETVRATLDWFATQERSHTGELKAGISRERERELLEKAQEGSGRNVEAMMNGKA